MSGTYEEPSLDFKRAPIVALLLTGGFVTILNQTLLITALPSIMREFHISASTVQWITTGFMLTNGVMIPITAFLLRRFTTRQLFFAAMSIFSIGALIAGTANMFPVLLLGRIVQACGAGIMMPLMQTVFLTIFPREKRGAAMGMVGLVISFAPAIGPTFAGWLVDQYSWRILFFIVLPIALLDLVFAFFYLKNVTKRTFPKIDVLSIVLSSLGFGGVLYGFSSAGASGWSSAEVELSLIIGGATLICFIWRQLRLEEPMLEFRVFQYGIFKLTTMINVIAFSSAIGAEMLLPIYMQSTRGTSAFESGLLLLPGAIAMGIMSPIAGRIFDTYGARPLATIGMSIVVVTTIPLWLLSAHTSFIFICVMYTVRMAGVSMLLMPVNTAGLNELPLHLLPHGTAMTNTMRQVGASIGTALLVTIMTNGAAHAEGKTMNEALVHGINLAFLVCEAFAVLGLGLSFYIKRAQSKKQPAETASVKGAG